MKKKAQGDVDSVIVTLVVLLVSLAVLVLVYNKFGEALLEDVEKKNCQWNLLLSSVTKSPILSTETIPPNCKMTRKNITLEQLEKKKKSNKKEIEKFNKDYEDAEYVNFHSDIDKELLEFEMDRVIANEIKDCWSVAWMGKMPVFQEWWSLIDCKPKDDGDYECSCPENKECSLPKEVLSRLQFWDYEVSGPPAFCLLCSRIKFNQEIQDAFRGEEIVSLPEWMQKHPVLVDPQKRSYYEYTKDDVNKGIFYPTYKYRVNEPLAVVYSRVNIYKPIQYGERLFEGLSLGSYESSKSVNMLGLMPYSEVGEKCTYIIG